MAEVLDAEAYRRRFGEAPVQDDLDRATCEHAGEVGHHLCGVCSAHNKPRFICGCRARGDDHGCVDGR